MDHHRDMRIHCAQGTQHTLREVRMPDIHIGHPARQRAAQHPGQQNGRHPRDCTPAGQLPNLVLLHIGGIARQDRTQSVQSRAIQQNIPKSGPDQAEQRYIVVQQRPQISGFDLIHTRQHLAGPTHQARQVQQPCWRRVMRRSAQFGAISRHL